MSDLPPPAGAPDATAQPSSAPPSGSQPPPLVRALGRLDYESALSAMRTFTAQRTPTTPDEIWLVEHPPVFTLGLAGRTEHLHGVGAIPVVRTERGGQVTYHGPGQVLAYLLLDLRRRGLLVRELVCRIEAAAIDCLAEAGVVGLRKPGAPGIYVADGQGWPGPKIVALGLKISHGCSYHGLALNVDMDLSPFDAIDPCGYPGLAVTDLRRALEARVDLQTHAATGPNSGSSSAPISGPAALDHWGRRLADHLIARIGGGDACVGEKPHGETNYL